jgi:hypothetical protein
VNCTRQDYKCPAEKRTRSAVGVGVRRAGFDPPDFESQLIINA